MKKESITEKAVMLYVLGKKEESMEIVKEEMKKIMTKLDRDVIGQRVEKDMNIVYAALKIELLSLEATLPKEIIEAGDMLVKATKVVTIPIYTENK